MGRSVSGVCCGPEVLSRRASFLPNPEKCTRRGESSIRCRTHSSKLPEELAPFDRKEDRSSRVLPTDTLGTQACEPGRTVCFRPQKMRNERSSLQIQGLVWLQNLLRRSGGRLLGRESRQYSRESLRKLPGFGHRARWLRPPPL